MKVTMSPDRKYMTLEAEDEPEKLAFENVKTPYAKLIEPLDSKFIIKVSNHKDNWVEDRHATLCNLNLYPGQGKVCNCTMETPSASR